MRKAQARRAARRRNILLYRRAVQWYDAASPMILNFRDGWLRDFFLEDARGRRIPADLRSILFRKLQILDDACSDADLRVPPGNRFEKLRGKLEGWHSIPVNEQWRLIFRWNSERGEAAWVYLDNHSYR